jgi:hypothetical protein
MLRFLIALLREGAPSVWYWVVPVRRQRQRARYLRVPSGIYFDEDRHAMEADCGEYRLELLENGNHAKECASSLITLDVRPVSASLGWRSIRKGIHILHEHRI